MTTLTLKALSRTRQRCRPGIKNKITIDFIRKKFEFVVMAMNEYANNAVETPLSSNPVIEDDSLVESGIAEGMQELHEPEPKQNTTAKKNRSRFTLPSAMASQRTDAVTKPSNLAKPDVH